jgi:hypothetical protein
MPVELKQQNIKSYNSSNGHDGAKGPNSKINPRFSAFSSFVKFISLYCRCTCGNCQVLPKRVECVCCRSIDRYREKLAEVGEGENEKDCITDHDGFDPVCINQYVLETAWLHYKQQYGRNAYTNGPKHKLRRHVAYRQLVRWCYGFLGKEIRVTLPACAVSKIRAFFPPPEMEDNALFVGFMEFAE